ncbi:unnamed protein product [Meganyctiphanes norvegica]|uniref:Uncharacterized protein n=1 Tax=Meganyctiphanes norvegica TaxID=48144 RepID=A0AAV2SFK2_MEGNR
MPQSIHYCTDMDCKGTPCRLASSLFSHQCENTACIVPWGSISIPPPWVACVSACGLRDQHEVSPQNRSLVMVEQLWVLVNNCGCWLASLPAFCCCLTTCIATNSEDIFMLLNDPLGASVVPID